MFKLTYSRLGYPALLTDYYNGIVELLADL